MVSPQSGWCVIKDDRLDLDINFYQPTPNELQKVAPHLKYMNSINGYVALQIINRQLGNPIPLPEKDEMLSYFINAPEGKRQRVQKYIQNIRAC